MIDRYTYDDDGRIDEIVARNARVHLERLDKNLWMLIVECGKGTYVHLNISNVREFEKVLRNAKPERVA